jgi:competence protein ComEC
MGAFALGLALAEAPPPVTIGTAAAVLALLLALGAAGEGTAAARVEAGGSRVVPRAARVGAGASRVVPRAARVAAVAAALVLCGAAVGDLRLAAIDAPAARVRDGERVLVRAHLLTMPRPGPFGSSAEVAVAGGPLGGARLLARAARWAPLPRGVRVGEELRLEGRLEAIGPSPGGDFAAYLRGRGVSAELLVEEVRRTGAGRGGPAGALDGMRERAERAVVAGMPAEDGALLRGMVLGQDEAIEPGLREDFRDSGLAHLLAVSGQNVMLLAALALPALALAGMRPRARLAALVALIALYVPLAGAGPSLQRAGVMGIAGIAAIASSRPASRSYALLLAAALTLAWNPRAWTDPGWQLSFAAVGGILVLGVPLARGLRRLGDELLPRGEPNRAGAAARACVRVLADGVAITVAATLATAPLLAHHFGSVPLAGLPANLLALPAVAPAMWLGMVKIGVGQGGEPGAAAAGALGPLAAEPVAYIAALAERCADLPGGQLALPLRSPPAVLAAYAVLGVLAAATARATRPLGRDLPERAARWRRLPRARKAALAAALALAVCAIAAPALDGADPPGRLTVRFLDVGQGDATLIQHPDGTAVLFDGGPPEAGVARLLRKAGVERLAAVVATHASRDHHGGLAEVLRRFPVATLLDGGDGTEDPAFRAVLAEAARGGVRRLRATAPLTLTLAGGALRVRLLSPPPRPPGPPPEDPNPRAVVALVTAGAFDLLLSADAESGSLLPLELPDVDAMKVAHHGSADPGLPELLDRLDPELAAIEVGPNTYGHPAPSTLTALDRAGVATYRTDRHGTVSLTLDRGAMRVHSER